MKNSIAFLTLIVGTSLSVPMETRPLIPVGTIEIQAQERAAKIVKMKGLWWAAADQELKALNETLITRAQYIKSRYRSYFSPDDTAVILPPGSTDIIRGFNKTRAAVDYDNLTADREKIRADYNKVAELANTQKLDNKEFQLLCRDVASAFFELERTLDRIRITIKST